MGTRRIVVGYNGSDQAVRAARWALDEAAGAGGRVVLCYAYAWTTYVGSPGMADAAAVWPTGDTERAAAGLLAAAAREAARTHPSVPVSTGLLRAPAAVTLVEWSAGATLVVLGNREHSAIGGLLLSTSAEVAAHARCTAVVVRGSVRQDGAVVVGVEGSRAGDHALAFAFERAARRGVAVHAVAAGFSGHDAGARQLEAWRARYPTVPVRLGPAAGDPCTDLVDASTAAQLVVVAAPADKRRTASPFGSVTRHLLRQAACPVAVIRDAGERG